jgi:hypothetical protein
MFRPDLNECMLEERYLLAIANLGTIVPTTSGLVLLTPFPGANSSGAGSLGSGGPSGGSAASVSGNPIPGGFFITGLGGISSMRPGNLTGIASFGGSQTSSTSDSLTIQIGSGADSSEGFAGGPTAVVSHATVADPTVDTLLNPIGSSTTGTTILSPSQTYRYVAPLPQPPSSTMTLPGSSASTMPNSSVGTGIPNPYAPSVQVGTVQFGPTNIGRGIPNPLPGSFTPAPPLMPNPN